MDNKLLKLLKDYNRYQKGELTEPCELIIKNRKIARFDFSKYDLGSTCFLSIEFYSCGFRDVYLDYSNFGGSIFNHCILENNSLIKAYWNNVKMVNTTIKSQNALKTEFMNIELNDSLIEDSSFQKCIFTNLEQSTIKNVTFINCTFNACTFANCIFRNVKFVKCAFCDTEIIFEKDEAQFMDCQALNS